MFEYYRCRHGIGSCLLLFLWLGFGKMNDITCDPEKCVSQMNTFVSLNLQTLSYFVKSVPFNLALMMSTMPVDWACFYIRVKSDLSLSLIMSSFSP